MATNNSANQSGSGIQSLTTGGVFNGRTITGTANQISVSNGDGTAGNPTLSLTTNIYVSGISFNSGTDVLSTYANGTFTPTLTTTGGSPTVTYSSQVGRYTHVGTRVILSLRIALASWTGDSGTTQVAGLPFTSNSTSNNNSICPLALGGTTYGASVLWYNGNLAPNVTAFDIEGYRSASSSLLLSDTGPSSSTVVGTSFAYEG